jgi:putative oxidoreductase
MFDRLANYSVQALAVLRIVAAILFVHAGIFLLFGFPVSTTPAPPPELVAGILELVGGLLLLAGFGTRPVAFILCGMMAVAYWGFHAPMNPYPVHNMGTAAILIVSPSSIWSSPAPVPGASTTSGEAETALRSRRKSWAS